MAIKTRNSDLAKGFIAWALASRLNPFGAAQYGLLLDYLNAEYTESVRENRMVSIIGEIDLMHHEFMLMLADENPAYMRAVGKYAPKKYNLSSLEKQAF